MPTLEINVILTEFWNFWAISALTKSGPLIQLCNLSSPSYRGKQEEMKMLIPGWLSLIFCTIAKNLFNIFFKSNSLAGPDFFNLQIFLQSLPKTWMKTFFSSWIWRISSSNSSRVYVRTYLQPGKLIFNSFLYLLILEVPKQIIESNFSANKIFVLAYTYWWVGKM